MKKSALSIIAMAGLILGMNSCKNNSDNPRKLFNQIRTEVINEQQKVIQSNQVLTEADIEKLPKLLNTYLHKTGMVGKPVLWNADIIWEDTKLSLKLDAKQKDMTTTQFLSSKPVSRVMLMKIHGMPFQGIDIYHKGKGRMKGKILSLFTVVNAEGKEMNISELITMFGEACILNSLFMSENMRYEEIAENKIKAYFTDNGITVSGIFTFDKNGLITQFDTDQRYRDTGNGKSELTPFRARVNSYAQCGDYYLPKKLSIIWVIDGKEFEYFSGTIKNINFNVGE